MNVESKIRKLEIETRAYIGGQYVCSSDGGTIKKFSSYTGEELPAVSACTSDDVNKAVEIAKEAYKSGDWRSKTLTERKNCILKLADLMEEHIEELALLDTFETNRAFHNYYYDSLPKAIETLRYTAECADKYYDKCMPPQENAFSYITRIPLGVVALITPWNDPMVVDAWKYGPALLMGNSVLMKPAEQSSLSLIRLAELTKEAGIPDGVFNVLPGFGEVTGRALGLHNDVKGIFFTGSSDIGKAILSYSAGSNMKHVGLECGGKSPMIISKNCKDIPRAAKILAENMFYNQGQICSAPSRVIANKSIYDEFMDALYMECEKFVPGNPFDTDNNVGCVVSREQYNRIINYIETAKKDKADIYRAKTIKEKNANACCVQPTIISNVDNHATVSKEEIFGPVATILQYDTIEEAINIANDTKYGLAGAVFTDDLNEAYYAANRIEAGLVHVNSWGEDQNITPFGGIKESGIGKDRSMYALDEYSQLKTVWITF